MESKKYNNIKILFRYKKIILRRFEKEFGENKKIRRYNELSEEIIRKLFSFVITDIIELVCDCFKENGLHITKEDYFEQIRKSKRKIICNDEDLIISFPFIITNFDDFILHPISCTLYWDETIFGWTKCVKSNSTYLKVINKLNDGKI